MDDIFLHSDEGSTLRMELSPVAPTRAGNQQLNFEQSDQPVHDDDEGILTVVKPKNRKGAGLERMTKSLGTKVIIEIAKGMKRPEKPLQAAKLATEAGLIARSHTPVLPHFKEYKKDPNLIKDYIGKVAANFEMDTNSETVKAACIDMLQKRQKNKRHQIKKKYFDNVAANEVSIKSPVTGMPDDEWQGLVKMWSTPRHKETCEANKENKAKVQFQQKTGLRSYHAHIYAIKEERKGEELSAIDLFKATHNSKKDGFSEPVQKAIAEMESRILAPVREGEERKSAATIVAEVLTEECPSSTFLLNAGLQSTSSRNKFIRSNAVAAEVTDLKDKLKRSEEQGEAMREELAALKKKSEEVESAQAARDKEVELLRKKTEETDARFAKLMAMFGGSGSGN